MTHYRPDRLVVRLTFVNHLIVVDLGQLRIPSPRHLGGLVERELHTAWACFGHGEPFRIALRGLSGMGYDTGPPAEGGLTPEALGRPDRSQQRGGRHRAEAFERAQVILRHHLSVPPRDQLL